MCRAKKTVRRRSSAESSKTSKTSKASKTKPIPGTRRRRRPAAPAPSPEVEGFEDAVELRLEPPAREVPAEPIDHDPVVPLATPEIGFAARTPQAAPDRPHPDRRRAIFFDVENTSRAEHIARVIEHLGVDRTIARTEFIAVGNWRVIGHDTARLLARHGAQLVHSAPSVGVRDWSDLRIAVAAGVWLAAARAGDVIELVSDDRAFDAVGDVASSLGITFRRLSFRRLAGMRAGEPSPDDAVPEAPRPTEARRDHGRRRGRRGGRDRRDERERSPRTHASAPPPPAPPQHMTPTGVPIADEANAEPAMEPHTAPQDEIVGLIRELVGRSADRSVSIDTLANALKSRGFRRPPGSPRLITRLRRIRELTLDRAGRITLLDGQMNGPRPETTDSPDDIPDVTPVAVEPEPEPEPEPGNRAPAAASRGEAEFEEEEDGPSPGNVRDGEPTHERTITGMNEIIQQGDRRRRRSRRGGRGRWRGRSGAPAAP
jgi:hypothetical protein